MSFSIEITGGIGKHIMASSFIKWLSEKYPSTKINVISAYPDLFEYNPRINRNLHLNQPYLFEDYIKGTDFRKGDPYTQYEYYREKNKLHCMKLYPKAFGFNELNENAQAEVYLTAGEEMEASFFVKQNGPLITFQPFGGLLPGMTYTRDKIDSSQRDMPFDLACRVAAFFINKGFKVLQIRSPAEEKVPGCLQVEMPFRNLLAISKQSLGHIGIDSSMMHGAAIFKKPQLNFWGGTHKDNLGYEYSGVINAFNKQGMHGRPVLQLYDRAGVFPFKDKGDGKEFDYQNEEIEKYLNKFLLEITAT